MGWGGGPGWCGEGRVVKVPVRAYGCRGGWVGCECDWGGFWVWV